MISLAKRKVKIYHEEIIASDGYFGFSSFSWESPKTISKDEANV